MPELKNNYFSFSNHCDKSKFKEAIWTKYVSIFLFKTHFSSPLSFEDLNFDFEHRCRQDEFFFPFCFKKKMHSNQNWFYADNKVASRTDNFSRTSEEIKICYYQPLNVTEAPASLFKNILTNTCCNFLSVYFELSVICKCSIPTKLPLAQSSTFTVCVRQ